jgi:hypothetical protein
MVRGSHKLTFRKIILLDLMEQILNRKRQDKTVYKAKTMFAKCDYAINFQEKARGK